MGLTEPISAQPPWAGPCQQLPRASRPQVPATSVSVVPQCGPSMSQPSSHWTVSKQSVFHSDLVHPRRRLWVKAVG